VRSILVTYATTTGNTLTVAEAILKHLASKQAGLQTELVDMDDLTPSALLNYDLVFIGSSTWGEGEFNEVAEEFFEKLKNSKLDLSKTKFAVYGLGDKIYDNFCLVVELMTNQLKDKKAEVLGETLKINGFPDEKVIHSVEAWLDSILKTLK